jgi:DNA sulfur modification protein DndB
MVNSVNARYVSPCLKTDFSGISVYTFPMKVKDVVFISYVAVRGVDAEEGAVQRVLNRRRVAEIRDFILSGNSFLNTFILNWTDKNLLPEYSDGNISIPISPAAAQMIDGQHRLAGLNSAMEAEPDIGEKEIIVSLCIDLNTPEAAAIFLNINSKQTPVPKSLIYDLFGEVESDTDHAINRANDIAHELNDSPESPYYKAIKFPGNPRGVGIIDLSTVVSALKPHLMPDGKFANVNITSLDLQRQVVLNYFIAIKSYYDSQDLWYSKIKNPFFKSAGFNGAIDYLASTLIMKCAEARSFKVDTFKRLLQLDSGNLLLHDEIKSLDGKTARKRISDYLSSHVVSALPQQQEYEF